MKDDAQYRDFFQSIYAVTLLIDPDTGAVKDANPAACAFYGWPLEELKEKRIFEINTMTEKGIRAEMQAARMEERNHFFFKHRLASGEVRDVEVHSGPIFVQGEHLLYSVIHDITESKQAEEALRHSEERLRSVIETSPDHILLLDTDLNIEFANYASPGLTVEELIGNPIYLFAEEENQDEIKATLEGVLKTEEAVRYETAYNAPDGTVVYYETYAVVRRAPDSDAAIGLALSARDITERC